MKVVSLILKNGGVSLGVVEQRELVQRVGVRSKERLVIEEGVSEIIEDHGYFYKSEIQRSHPEFDFNSFLFLFLRGAL